MGQADTGKIIIVLLIFMLSSLFVYGKNKPVRSIDKQKLNEALVTMDGWRAGINIPFDDTIIKSLALDDYLNKKFNKKDKSVSLYIGYYLTADKVGAAHDPLVCFPGQGWVVLDKNTGVIQLNNGSGERVKYATMMVARGEENKQVILYWFQSYDAASNNTFSQKITTLLQRFSSAKEDNAFVRLSCAASDDRSVNECMQTMKDFTKSFYPVFLEYIRK